MSTQITNKQVKVITDTNFNNTKIVNAKIDASENDITGVSTELYAGNNISIDGATISAIVPTKVSELDNDSQYITNVVDDLVNYTTTANLSSVALSGDYNDLINKPIIDSELSDSSTNAVENRVINNEFTRIESLTITNASNIILETSNRQTADNNLQQQIDAITAASDVTDVVGTYQDLQNYDTQHLKDNDIIKVLQDSTHNNASSYYRWNDTTEQFSYIGSEGPYYTKNESDEIFVPQTLTINNIGLSNNIILTKNDIGLGNVDNTSDVNKPISTATQNALNNKQDLLPSQSGQNGKFLTTNGTSLSWAEVQSGSSYIAGAGIDEAELEENNKIALKTNWVFRNNLYINENSSIPSNKITIDNDIFFEYIDYPDNIFIDFQYDGTNWKVDDNIVDLEDYGITIDSSYSLSNDDNFIIAGNYIANKNEFEVIFLEFANVFLNGLLLCENLDYTLETTEMGTKITFIDYILKATDRIQIL